MKGMYATLAVIVALFVWSAAVSGCAVTFNTGTVYIDRSK